MADEMIKENDVGVTKMRRKITSKRRTRLKTLELEGVDEVEAREKREEEIFSAVFEYLDSL